MKSIIKIGCLTEDGLTAYSDNQIIITGIRGESKIIYKILKKNNLNVVAFYLSKDRPYIVEAVVKLLVEIRYPGATIFKERQMKDVHKFFDKPLLIDKPGAETYKTSSDYHGKRELIILSGSQLKTSFYDKNYIARLKTSFYRLVEELTWKYDCETTDKKTYRKFRKNNKYNSPIYICLPPKTADNTLHHTFNSLSEKIHYYNFGHRPRFFKPIKNNKKVRIITAVREPISQNLSCFYQTVGSGSVYRNMIMGKLENVENKNKLVSLQLQEQKFLQCKDNANEFF